MNQTRDQELSSWVDGEVSGAEAERLLSTLSGDTHLRQTLGRYHLVSDYLRGETIRLDGTRIVDRVSAALENEPVVLAPNRRGTDRHWGRYVGGGAIAASVALVAVLSFSGDPGRSMEEPITVARAPLAPSAKEVADAQMRSPARSVIEQQQLNSQLDRILAEHSEYAGSGGVQGILPYTTFVSYDAQ